MLDARVEHVGSLLRPRELLEARARRDAGALDAPAFKAIEDDAVRGAVALQEAAGCPVVTDGELRRDSFQSELTAACDGFAGIWQPVEAYDVLVANLSPTLPRRPPAGGPADLLARFPEGLTTQEVAALLADGNDAPDRAGAEDALIELTAGGGARRRPVGDDALWTPGR